MKIAFYLLAFVMLMLSSLLFNNAYKKMIRYAGLSTTINSDYNHFQNLSRQIHNAAIITPQLLLSPSGSQLFAADSLSIIRELKMLESSTTDPANKQIVLLLEKLIAAELPWLLSSNVPDSMIHRKAHGHLASLQRIDSLINKGILGVNAIIDDDKQKLDNAISMMRMQMTIFIVLSGFLLLYASIDLSRLTAKKEKRFRALVEHGEDVILLTNREGKVIYVSPGIEKLTGFTAKELTGKNIVMIMHPDYVEASKNVFKRLLKTPGSSIPGSNRLITKNGGYVDVEGTVSNFLDDKNVEAVITNFRDVTQRKLAQEKLASSELRFRTLIENSADIILMLDNNFRVIYRSPSSQRITGFTDADMLGQDGLNFIHPDDRPFAKKVFAEVISNPGIPVTFSGRNLLKNGKYIWVKGLATNFLHNESINALVFNFRDITEQKENKENLIKSEQHYRNLFEHATDAIYIADASLHYIDINPAGCKMLGYTKEEFLQLTPRDLLFEDDAASFTTALQETQSGRSVSYVRKMKRKDGSALPVEVNANQQKDGRFIIFARDITDRNKLQAQQLLFASIVDATDDAILTTSLDGTITSWNHGAEKTYGYAADEMIGKQITRLIPAHLHRQEFDMLHKIKNGEVIDHFQTERIKKNGESIYVSLTISPLKDAAGNIIGAAKISRDITGQKEAREKLVRSEQIYRTIASSIPGSIICLLDTDFRYVLIEGDLVENIGYSKEILLGRTIKEAFGTEAFENVEEDLRSVLQGETVTRQIHHNGYDLISRFIPLNDENNVVYSIMTVALDITEIKNAQRSILELNENLERKVIERTEQLEAANIELQQFAYIASHDLQQPLRTVSNYMQIFEEDYKGQLDARALKYIVSVNNATKRMSSLIHSLLEFSKLTHTKKRLLTNCNNLIADVLADLDTLIKNNNAIIEIGEMPHLHLYEIEMRQLFQNLVLNAIKFQPPGNRPLVKIYSERKDDKWQFSVSDNGIGIEPEYFDRIFDIFKRLHTNNAYEGSGIGLANCKKIVQLHHGEIWVESTVGIGSTFYFTIQNLEG